MAQIRVWKLCQNQIRGYNSTLGGLKNYAMPHSEALIWGLTSDTLSPCVKVSCTSLWRGHSERCSQGCNAKSSNAHNLFIFQQHDVKFSPFVDGLPYYKLMQMQAQSKEYFARLKRLNFQGHQTEIPHKLVSKHCCGQMRMAIFLSLLALAITALERA